MRSFVQCLSLIVATIVLATSVASAGFLVGDLNGDNRIDWDDLLTMADQWLSAADTCTEEGLVAHWKLDEGDGTTAADASGLGRDGTAYGQPLWYPSEGRIGGTLEFDGVDDYVEVSGFTGITGAAPRTCTAWIKTIEGNGEIITWGDRETAGYKWFFLVDYAGRLRLAVEDGYVLGTAAVNDGLWHHAAVVSRGATTDGIELYVDGQLEYVSDRVLQSINTAGTTTVKIGVYSDVLKYFQGRIDDVRIYDRALSVQEVWTLAQTRTTNPDCADIDYREGVDIADFTRLADNWMWQTPAVVINEIMADNELILATHAEGVEEYPDWIELFNSSPASINLDGWYLTDKPGNLDKWPFPPGTTIDSGQYLIVFASGRKQADYPGNYPFVDDDGYLHTNFKLTSGGEYLALVTTDNDDLTVVHEFSEYEYAANEFGFPPQREDISYGVLYNELAYFGIPTPGNVNSGGFLGFVDKPKFSWAAGFYDAPFNLVISCSTPGATIRYTTDGSDPTVGDNGNVYTDRVRIEETTCLRAVAFLSGYQPSPVRTASFLFDASDAIKSLPVISIVGDEEKSLFLPDGVMAIKGGNYNAGYWLPGTTNGQEDSNNYNNPMHRTFAYERPVSVEILHADGRNNTQIDCGIRVAGSDYHRPRYTMGGNWLGNYNKFSFKLFFRDSYGDGRFDYPVFPLFDVDSFKSFMLRGGHNDVVNPFVKDEFLRRVGKDTGCVSPSGMLANVFINGVYKAYYNPTERLDHDFFRTWYNSDNDWDVVTQRSTWTGIARNGDMVSFNNMVDFFRYNSMTVDANYGQAREILDISDFVDYLLVQLWSGNWDWPTNNWAAACERAGGAKWRFYLWDVEGSMEGGQLGLSGFDDMPSYWPGGLNGHNDAIPYVYRSLKASEDFKQIFADRIQKHFFQGGALTQPNLQKRFRQLRQEMAEELPGMSTYVPNTWIPQREAIILDEFRLQGLFPLEGPVFRTGGKKQREGYVPDDATLTINNPGGTGTVWYTTNGVDPRKPIVPLQTTTVLVSEDAEKRVFAPDVDINTDWRGDNEPYDDSGWTHGTPATPRQLAGVGYERDSGYEGRISYDIDNELYGNSTRSALIRIPFDVKASDLGGFNVLTLKMRYDDGFVAYINGSEVYRQNITGEPGTGATVSGHEDYGQESFVISGHIDKLKAGGNILAVHGMNVSATSSDFIILPELIAASTSGGGGGVADSAVAYSGGITLDKTVHVKARVLDGGTWSGLTEGVYVVGAVNNNLRISEIMYHPFDPNEDVADSEFIELENAGDEPINLNLVRFSNGIEFEFGDMTLPAGQEVVLVRDETAFLSRHDDFAGTIAGEFTGSLDNGGERIGLVDGLGRTIAEFKYDDDWFDITDGGGFSLTLRDSARHLAVGPIACWKLDEKLGSIAGDSSGNVLNGRIRGYPAWVPYSGKHGGALEFYGDGDYVEITGYKGILGSNPRTCAAWIKTTDSGVIVNWGPIGPGVRWTTVLNGEGYLRQEVGGGATVGSTIVGDGKWHHVAVASDGTDVANIVLYVDGKRDTPGSVSSRTIDTQAAGDASIGAFSGMIDNVCLYDRVLGDAEIALLAESDDYWEDKRYWQPSAQMGGSPGEDDPDIIPELGSIVINEVLAHSHALDPDWIELYNATTDQTIDIGGWFLSDGKGDYMKYRIPDTTTLGPGEYIVFLETFDFDSFALSENGDEVYLRSGLDENGDITGYYEEEIFGASRTNVSLGRYQKSTGAFNFVAMSSQTLNAANADPRVGPVVISEIMYHPTPGGPSDKEEYEYVELYNTTDSTVPLYEYDADVGQDIPWKFTDGIEYTFPLGTEIAPYGYLLVVKNTTAFADRHGSPAGVEVLGPYDKNLNNNGEKLEISMPGDTDEEGRHYIRIDRVVYNDAGDWPQSADGGGMSLTRIDKTAYGNDVINWQAATGSPGE